jgi:hypothetical protein
VEELTSGGRLRGVARMRAWGTLDGEDIDCSMQREISVTW